MDETAVIFFAKVKVYCQLYSVLSSIISIFKDKFLKQTINPVDLLILLNNLNNMSEIYFTDKHFYT